jgi:hypothetical protein
MVAPPCPVIDADDIQWLMLQQRHVAPGRTSTGPRTGRAKLAARRPPSARPRWWTTAVESPGSSRRWRQDIAGETLYEDLSAAQHGVAPKAARNDPKLDTPSRQRQVADPTVIPTVHTPRNGTAGWTCRRFFRCTNCVGGIVARTNNSKTAGYQ